MKRIFSLFLTLLLLLPLACGSNVLSSDDPNLGTYRADTIEYSGFSVSVTDFFEEGFEIELKSSGKCELRVDGEKANGKWTLDGNAFTVKGGGIDCSGTLDGGLMRLQYDDDVVINLISDRYSGTAAPAGSITPIASTEQESDPQTAVESQSAEEPQAVEETETDLSPSEDSMIGSYQAVAVQSGSYELPVSRFYDEAVLLDIRSDGTAVFQIGGESESCTWTINGSVFTLTAPGSASYTGTWEDGQLMFSADTAILYFFKQEDPRVHRFDSGYLIIANQTGATIHNIYISDDPESWGDSVLNRNQMLDNGASITLSFSESGITSGVYDFGAIDESRLNFDIYDVTIQNGDMLILMKISDEACVLSVIHADNSSDQYTGKCYTD